MNRIGLETHIKETGDRPSAETGPYGYKRVELLSVASPSPRTYVLRFPKTESFRAGQMVGVTTGAAVPPRFYSLSGGTDEPFLEVLFTVVEDGLLTPDLASLRPGDQIYVSPPSGSFVDGEGRSWWIASGTGVAPFASMVRSGFTEGKTLVHGSRTLDGFHYAGLFSEALGDRYVRCSSGERASGIYGGRLTEWLRDRTVPVSGVRYFLCGSSAMVVEVRDILLEKGVPFDLVVSEIYF